MENINTYHVVALIPKKEINKNDVVEIIHKQDVKTYDVVAINLRRMSRNCNDNYGKCQQEWCSWN